MNRTFEKMRFKINKHGLEAKIEDIASKVRSKPSKTQIKHSIDSYNTP